VQQIEGLGLGDHRVRPTVLGFSGTEPASHRRCRGGLQRSDADEPATRKETLMTSCSETSGDLAPQARLLVRRIMTRLDERGALPDDEEQITLITLGILDAVVAGARLGHSEAMAQIIKQLDVLAPHVHVEATFRSELGPEGLLEQLRGQP
jgi:hypothetical protein